MKGGKGNGEGEATCLLGEDDRGRTQGPQQAQGQAGCRLGRVGCGRRLRPLRAGQGCDGADQGQKATEAH